GVVGSGGNGRSGNPCVPGVIITDPPALVLPPAVLARQAGCRSLPRTAPASTPARPRHPIPAAPRPTETSPSAPRPRSATSPPHGGVRTARRPAGAARLTCSATPSPGTPASPASPKPPAHWAPHQPRPQLS